MSTAMQTGGGAGPGVERSSGQGLADVVDTILDKGLVIDAYVNVSLVGIQLVTIDARVVVASVDTYLRFAEAVGRLDLTSSQGNSLPDVVEGVQESGAGGKVKGATKGAIAAAGESVRDLLSDDRRESRSSQRRER
jgi:gas vesicle structural protein